MPKFNPAPNKINRRIIRRAELLEITGLSYFTIWESEKKGEFPARIQLGKRAVGWFSDEVLTWLEDRRTKPGAPAPIPCQGNTPADTTQAPAK